MSLTCPKLLFSAHRTPEGWETRLTRAVVLRAPGRLKAVGSLADAGGLSCGRDDPRPWLVGSAPTDTGRTPLSSIHEASAPPRCRPRFGAICKPENGGVGGTSCLPGPAGHVRSPARASQRRNLRFRESAVTEDRIHDQTPTKSGLSPRETAHFEDDDRSHAQTGLSLRRHHLRVRGSRCPRAGTHTPAWKGAGVRRMSLRCPASFEQSV